jgi:hypothetical protein
VNKVLLSSSGSTSNKPKDASSVTDRRNRDKITGKFIQAEKSTNTNTNTIVHSSPSTDVNNIVHSSSSTNVYINDNKKRKFSTIFSPTVISKYISTSELFVKANTLGKTSNINTTVKNLVEKAEETTLQSTVSSSYKIPKKPLTNISMSSSYSPITENLSHSDGMNNKMKINDDRPLPNRHNSFRSNTSTNHSNHAYQTISAESTMSPVSSSSCDQKLQSTASISNDKSHTSNTSSSLMTSDNANKRNWIGVRQSSINEYCAEAGISGRQVSFGCYPNPILAARLVKFHIILLFDYLLLFDVACIHSTSIRAHDLAVIRAIGPAACRERDLNFPVTNTENLLNM